MAKLWRLLRNFAFVIIVFAVLFSYAMFQGGFTSWFLFYSFLPIFLYHVCFLVYPLHKWTVLRTVSQQIVPAGSRIKATITINRTFPFPLFYCVCEEILPTTLMKMDNRQSQYSDLSKAQQKRASRIVKSGTFPLFKRKIQVEYSLDHIPRGEHPLTAIRVRTGDVFGFIKKEHIFHVASKIVAYPSVRSMKLLEQVASFEQGTNTTNTLHLKNTNVATGIRDYMPGDKFSWIDWKQTAKKNDVMTKEFEQEKSNDTLIVLNACQEKPIPFLAFEAAVEVCYSLIVEITKRSSQVGLLSVGEESIYFPVQQTRAMTEEIKRHVTKVQQVNGNFSIKLLEQINTIANHYTIFIITTEINEALLDQLRRLHIQKRNIHLIYIQSFRNITNKKLAQLRNIQVDVAILTEKELVKNPIEVNAL